MVVRDRFKTIAVVGAAIRYALSLPFCKPSRVGVVAVPLEIGPHDGIGVIAVTWCVVEGFGQLLAQRGEYPEDRADDGRRGNDFPPHGWRQWQAIQLFFNRSATARVVYFFLIILLV